jgi:hypothetical protein
MDEGDLMVGIILSYTLVNLSDSFGFRPIIEIIYAHYMLYTHRLHLRYCKRSLAHGLLTLCRMRST